MTTSINVETVARDRYGWYRDSVIYPGVAVGFVALAVVLLPFTTARIVTIAIGLVMYGELIRMMPLSSDTRNIGHLLVARWRIIGLTLIEACLITTFMIAITRIDLQAGSEILAVVIFCTYANDVLAYYGGKGFSRRWEVFERKLAPMTSPGKTVIGFACGVIAALALAGVISGIFGARYGELKFMAAVAIFTVIGVGGDLLESRIKRLCMVKDSSNLLGGMGGILDRNDALTVSSIVAWGFISIHWL